MDKLKQEFTTLTLVLIPVAVAINLAVGQLVIALKLPLYLDSIGTVLVAVLVGPWSGALTGVISSVIWTATGWFPQAIAWVGVAAVIGILAAAFKQGGWLDGPVKAGASGLITGIVAAFLSAPIAAYVFGGVTGTGTDVLVAAFSGTFGLDILGANMAQGVVSDPIDKLVTFLIVWALLRSLPVRLQARFSGEE